MKAYLERNTSYPFALWYMQVILHQIALVFTPTVIKLQTNLSFEDSSLLGCDYVTRLVPDVSKDRSTFISSVTQASSEIVVTTGSAKRHIRKSQQQRCENLKSS